MLIEEGFVTPQPPTNDRWEPVFHWNDGWKDGYGELHRVFHRNQDQIIEWSRSNREVAQIYWSEGFRLLRSDKDVDVAAGREILRACWRNSTAEELRAQMQILKDEVAMYFEDE